MEFVRYMKQDGEGIAESAKWIADRLSFKKRQAGVLPPRSRELLATVGQEPINSLTIVRAPIESYINKALQLISGGTWEDAVRKAGYDKLFHLGLLINGKYMLHKIETTTLERAPPMKAGSETMPVAVPRQLSIGTLIENTLRQIGPQRFTEYNPVSQNCQDFLLDVLRSNGLLTPAASQFIKQDAVAIFKQTPQLTARIANFVTDLGARWNRFVQGEGLHKFLAPQKRRAKELGMHWVKDIIISPSKKHKYQVIFKDGTKINYGRAGSSDFLQHGDSQKRANFWKRWSKNPHIDNIHSPAYYLRLNW